MYSELNGFLIPVSTIYGTVKSSLTCCINEGFEPSVLKEHATGNEVILDINKGTFRESHETESTMSSRVHSVLYVKDKYSVSNETYHQLSVMSDLPTSNEIKPAM